MEKGATEEEIARPVIVVDFAKDRALKYGELDNYRMNRMDDCLRRGTS